MVEGDERPVGHYAGDALGRGVVGADDEVFDGGGVEHDDVWESEDLREEGGGEEGGVFDDDEGAFIFEGDTDFGEEAVGGFSDDLWGYIVE